MSFILDALKKLEREKQTREPDVVMVGPVSWGGADRNRARPALVVSVVALAVITGGTVWWLASGSGSSPTPASGTAAGGAASAPSTSSPGTASRAATEPQEPSTTITPSAPAPRRLDLPVAETMASGAQVSTVPEESSRAATGTPVVAEDQPAAASMEDDAQETEFRLSAISTREGEPIALLNDRLVREGDAFDGVRILRIGTTEIEIEVDGERRTIGF